MAKIKFGMMMTDARGKLGGQVFSKNRAGAYTRTKVTPVNPNTSAQIAARGRLTAFSQGFRSLTPVQIDAWNAAVADFKSTDIFGDLKTPTGLNLYVKLNANIDLVGGAAIDSPPNIGAVANAPAVLTTLSVAADVVDGIDITFAPTPVPANNALVIEATRPLSAGKSFVKNEFRVIQIVDAAGTSPADVTAAYEAKFGAIEAGQKVFVRVTPINKLSGIKGASLEASTIATA